MKPVCLVTGAAGRLGTSLCAALLPQYEVIGVFNRHEPSIPSQLRKKINGIDGAGGAFCIQADLTKRDDIRQLVEVALARFDRIDGMRQTKPTVDDGAREMRGVLRAVFFEPRPQA